MKNSDRILVPYDFTDPADKALKLASAIALKNGMGISLLHINDQSIGDVDSKLKLFIGMFELSSKINFDYIIKQGKVISEISKVSADPIYKLMVIGSHGYKGFREKVMGADIFKLVKNLSLPVVVIQKEYIIPENGIDNIILPVFTDRVDLKLPESITRISEIFSAEICFFESKIIDSKEYAEQLINYARNMDQAMITIPTGNLTISQMLTPKAIEMLLTNLFGIPILSISEG